MPEQQGRIIGYHCSTHNFHCAGKMALQLHINGTNGECAAGPVREDEEPAPVPTNPTVPSKLSTDQKEEVIRLYYCSLHHYAGTGNVNTCPQCVRGYIRRHHGADVAMTGLIAVHLAPEDDPDTTTCGLSRPFVSTGYPRRVTCPDCLIMDYFNQEGVTNPVDNWKPAPLPPKPEPAITLNRHDPLPMYEHDCRDCIFLGTETVGGHEYDLYFHPDEKVPTVIARESSEGGDYRSGLEFVERDGALALAYVRALRRRLLTTN